MAVSKFRPIEELEEAYAYGHRVFAESRPAEFEAKVLALPKDIEWHFIGHLQTNKLRHVLPYAYMIQSVDSIHLLAAIEKWCSASGKSVRVLLEVHVSEEDSKQGFSPDEILTMDLNAMATEYPHVTICGLMGMASHTDDAGRIEADFALMKSLLGKIMDSYPAFADSFNELSIGMSEDWQLAVKHGATMVRIGSAIFNR